MNIFNVNIQSALSFIEYYHMTPNDFFKLLAKSDSLPVDNTGLNTPLI
jgi:hypothetical protein